MASSGLLSKPAATGYDTRHLFYWIENEVKATKQWVGVITTRDGTSGAWLPGEWVGLPGEWVGILGEWGGVRVRLGGVRKQNKTGWWFKSCFILLCVLLFILFYMILFIWYYLYDLLLLLLLLLFILYCIIFFVILLFISLLFYSIAVQPGTIISFGINKVLSYLIYLICIVSPYHPPPPGCRIRLNVLRNAVEKKSP